MFLYDESRSIIITFANVLPHALKVKRARVNLSLSRLGIKAIQLIIKRLNILKLFLNLVKIWFL